MRKIIIGAFMIASASMQAQTPEQDLYRFYLYTNCAPVNLLVESLPPDAADIGLTEEDVTTTVRSRQRGAHIYTFERLAPTPYVNVNVVGLAFGGRVELKKFVQDLETELIFKAPTWQIGGIGMHGRNSGYLLQSIGHFVDQFISIHSRQ